MRAVLSVEPVKIDSPVGDHAISYTSPEVTLWQLLAYSSVITDEDEFEDRECGCREERQAPDVENDPLTGWH
jgi:hypothetical protein